MSYVYNTILSISGLDTDKIQQVNSFFTNSEWPQQGFVEIHEANPNNLLWYGGNKGFEAPLYIGAFNYLSIDGLLEHLRSIDFVLKEDVCLIWKEQEGLFEMIHVFEDPHKWKNK